MEDFVVTDEKGKPLFVGKPPVKYFRARRGPDGEITERCNIGEQPLTSKPVPPKVERE